MKISTTILLKKKKAREKITMLTAYSCPLANILDEAGVDIVLVGDSVGNVALGYKNTIPVTMLEIMVHTQAVARGVKSAMVVADMPFGSYQVDKNEAVGNAIELAKAGAEAVKVEGAGYIDAIKAIIKAGIPVMGHLGFTPQSVYELGGYKIQGRGAIHRARIIKDARALEKAGCFAIVLEMVPPELAKKISKALKIPVIGIGAGKDCDGQVLVTHDMLGFYENPPSFVKVFTNMRSQIKKAVSSFIEYTQDHPQK
ncbi:MAG: 3-methyl-2-oxobutanoate hydroxymethyltransferase [Candidatus Margulisbacteria bacterium]|nr:3-methyl-2-oxobutanoate hydroxymethyltransferase [Candidatus Margulisiibacteriota bacterium]